MNFQINFLTMFLQRLLNDRPVTCLTITSENVYTVDVLDTFIVSLSPKK